ncbi:MAG: prephenate dehydratase domain-containing protein, partial [Vicinamibacterales bacterium]
MITIAYQGEPGAFSEAASRQLDAGATLLPCRAFEDVFDAVNAGRADFGVLPIENSIGGSIHRNFDLLQQNDLPIVAETEVPVVHHLLALPGTTLAQVRRIYSHPQGLAQCDRFLRTLTGVELIATYDTAGSAKMIADEHLADAAAIASARAGALFGLEALRSGIQDFEGNTTRFLVIGKR